jgi:hypothetical protein
MFALLLLPRVLPLTFDDIAIGILTGHKCIESRILPMSHAWYQFVPEVNLYTESMPESAWPALLANRRANLFFHINTAIPRHLVGNEYDVPWNYAQTRHILAMADLYERYPNRSFYFLGDDDTWLVPGNLLKKLSNVDPESLNVFGRTFTVVDYAHPFFGLGPGHVPVFCHGGSGVVLPRGLMRVVGPKLRNCSLIFEVANVGSDVRFAMCVAHTTHNGARFVPDRVMHSLEGMNPDVPDYEVNLIGSALQITFHRVFGGKVPQFFAEMVTVVGGDWYYDWSPFIWRMTNIDIGGHDRPFWFVFAHVICLRRGDGVCVKAINGIEVTDHPLANFSQNFAREVVVYYRCNPELDDEEVLYFCEPAPPETGVILELKCPELKQFVNRSNGQKRLTIEDAGFL